MYTVKDGLCAQITLHTVIPTRSRAGIDLATYGLREKRIDLSPT